MKTFVKQIAMLCKAHPRQTLGIALGLVILGALAVVTSFLGTIEWRTYHLTGTILTLDLPAEPRASKAKLGGDVSALYQASCQEVAVFAGGGPIPPGEKADVRYIAEQVVNLLCRRPGITKLKYQMGPEHINGNPCLLVAGAFERDGVPSHLSGAFFVGKKAHAHVVCLWSNPKGANKAARILNTIELREPSES